MDPHTECVRCPDDVVHPQAHISENRQPARPRNSATGRQLGGMASASMPRRSPPREAHGVRLLRGIDHRDGIAGSDELRGPIG
ncbi:hypothetical protein [Cellulomonas massiliensis]|uniref:hypothetical protein n=1 Tax=Cellulomonas massiliensis TaxID=1465811 RepID=UPI0002F53F34|nr:hypothetical protein [Cellulomonas massiliensis]